MNWPPQSSGEDGELARYFWDKSLRHDAEFSTVSYLCRVQIQCFDCLETRLRADSRGLFVSQIALYIPLTNQCPTKERLNPQDGSRQGNRVHVTTQETEVSGYRSRAWVLLMLQAATTTPARDLHSLQRRNGPHMIFGVETTVSATFLIAPRLQAPSVEISEQDSTFATTMRGESLSNSSSSYMFAASC